jgi:hypothetical protein
MHREEAAAMIQTVVSGVVALTIAIIFFGVLLLKVHEPVLWIVILIGLALMVAGLIEGVRGGDELGERIADLPEGQQKRGGVS